MKKIFFILLLLVNSVYASDWKFFNERQLKSNDYAKETVLVDFFDASSIKKENDTYIIEMESIGESYLTNYYSKNKESIDSKIANLHKWGYVPVIAKDGVLSKIDKNSPDYISTLLGLVMYEQSANSNSLHVTSKIKVSINCDKNTYRYKQLDIYDDAGKLIDGLNFNHDGNYKYRALPAEMKKMISQDNAFVENTPILFLKRNICKSN